MKTDWPTEKGKGPEFFPCTTGRPVWPRMSEASCSMARRVKGHSEWELAWDDGLGTQYTVIDCLLFVLAFFTASTNIKGSSLLTLTVTSSLHNSFFYTFNFLSSSTYKCLGTWPSGAFVTSTCDVEDGLILVHAWMSSYTVAWHGHSSTKPSAYSSAQYILFL